MREATSQVMGLFQKLADDAVQFGDPVVSGDSVLPVLPALRGLFSDGGLAKGGVVTVERLGLLCLALVAGASAAGAWCGAAGLPDLGVVAAAGVGADPARLMLVADPGPNWPQVLASMLEACEIVVVRPPAPPGAQSRRRLEAVLRRGGGVLVVAGEWEGAPVRLRVTQRLWAGIGDGYGSLRACRAEVVAEGRGAAARPRRCWLWLPAPDGTVTPDDATTFGRPAYDRPAYERPAFDRPDLDRPDLDQSGLDRPAFDRPVHERVAVGLAAPALGEVPLRAVR